MRRRLSFRVTFPLLFLSLAGLSTATAQPKPRGASAKLLEAASRTPEELRDDRVRLNDVATIEAAIRSRKVRTSEEAERDAVVAHLDAARSEVARRRLLQERVDALPELRADIARRLAGLEAKRTPPAPDQIAEQIQILEARISERRAQIQQLEANRTARAERAESRPAARDHLAAEVARLTKAIQERLTVIGKRNRQWWRLVASIAERLVQAERAATLQLQARVDQADEELGPELNDVLVRELAEHEERVARLKDLQATSERSSAQGVLRLAQETVRAVDNLHPVVTVIAKENERFAARMASEGGLLFQLREAERRTEDLTARSADFERVYRELQQLVREAGLSVGLGQLLRGSRAVLSDERRLEEEVADLSRQIAQVTVDRFDVRNRRKRLSNPSETTQARFQAFAGASPSVATATVTVVDEQWAAQLLRQQQELLEELDQRYARLLVVQQLLRDALVEHREITHLLGTFLDQRLVWIRSQKLMGIGELSRIGGGLRELASPRWVTASLSRIAGAWVERPFAEAWPWLLAMVVVFGLRRAPPQLWRTRRTRPFVTFGEVVLSLGVETAAAAAMPLVVFAVGRTLRNNGVGSTADAVSLGLFQVAFVWFGIAFIRRLARSGGLADRDFRAGDASMRLVHDVLGWLLGPLLLFVFFFSLIRPEQQESVFAPLSRLAFIGGMTLVSVAVFRIADPERPLIAPLFVVSPEAWLYRLRYPVFFFLMGIPVTLGLLAVAGYFYTAIFLEVRFMRTMTLVVTLLLARSLMLTWLRYARRKALVRHREAAQEATAEDGASVRSQVEEAAAEFEVIDAQTRQVFRGLLIVALVVGVSAVWSSVLPALEGLERVEVYPRVLHVEPDGGYELPADATFVAASKGEGQAVSPPAVPSGAPPATTETRVSARDLLLALFISMLTIAAVRNLPGLLEVLILQQLPLESGTRYAFSMILRYGLAVIGLLAALETVELGWSKVQWLVAALTFGLGFGLQEVFANFISGLIILFERPIRVGDIVTASGITGRVERINMRATTIIDYDNKELVVPNKDFIIKEIINWSLSDSVLRTTIEVGVAYGSDVEKALALLVQIAEDHEAVLADPPPVARFLSFGDSSLLLKLFAFSRVDERLAVTDALHRKIDAAFRREGIVIAFPQLDVNLATSPAPAETPG